MEIKIIKPQDQAFGQFDGGKIIEQKPIGFSGEGSFINRLGPLFYWAWAKRKLKQLPFSLKVKNFGCY